MIINRFKSRTSVLVVFCVIAITHLLVTNNVLAQNAPITGNDENFTYQDNAVTGNVYDNDYDLDGDELSYSIVTSTPNGTWDLQSNGDYTYTPNPFVIGVENMVYQACDEDGMCTQGTLTMYVIFLNDAPQANDDSFNAELNTTRTFNARLNDVEPDNEVMLFYMVAPPSNGTATINVSTGVVTYTPTNGYTGPDSFIYQACDPCNVCNQAVVSIMVLPNNAPPVFSPVSIAATEDQIWSGSLTGFVTDPDGDQLTFGLITNSQNGNVSISPTGTATFNPQNNFNGSTSFLFQACDIVGQCTSAIAFVTVNPINDSPTANNDAANGSEDLLLSVAVSGNDSDVEPGTLTYSIVTAPSSGTLNFMTNGNFTFTAPSNQSGSFSFTYQVCDSGNLCAIANVTLTIAAINDTPVALNDTFSTTEDNVLNGTVANDTDIDSPILTYSYLSGANNGNINMSIDGTFSYAPDANWFGTENIIYQVCDNQNACSTGQLEIVVSYVNDAPIVQDEEFSTDEDNSISGNVSLNDNNEGEGALDFTVSGNPINGNIVMESNGTFTYIPNANWFGTENINYSACNVNNACDGGTLTITVYPVNDAPSCNSQTLALDEDSELAISISMLVEDVDNSSVTIQIDEQYSDRVDAPNSTTILYNPTTNFNGQDIVIVSFCDAANLCCDATIILNISPVNDNPSVGDGEYIVNEDNILSITLPEAADNDNDEITYALVSAPMNGVVIIDSNGAFTYTPNDNSFGMDFFTFSACDNDDACDAAIASIQINSINDEPLVDNEFNVCPLDLVISGDVSENDADIETTDLTYSILTVNGPGTLELGSDGNYTFTPTIVGLTTITYLACDADDACQQGILTIETIDFNTPPIATDGLLASEEDFEFTGNLANFVSDSEGGNLTYSLITGDSNAQIDIDPSGQITVVPTGNFFGVIAFTYQVCDNGNLCDQGEITMTIIPVNDAPTGSALELFSIQDAYAFGNLNLNIIDDSSNEFSFELLETNLPGSLIINPNGTFTFEPDQYQFGVYSLTYSICDEGELCDIIESAYFIIYQNDIPIAEDAIISTDEEQDYSGNLLLYTTELDQQALTFTVSSNPANGDLTLSPSGEFLYSPDSEFSGFDQFTFITCDEEGTCATATITIEVVFMNDLPIASDDFFMVLEDGSIAGTVSTNDVELDDEIDTYNIYDAPNHGTLIMLPNGNFTYTPNANYYGTDQAVVLMCDPCGACDFSILEFEVTFINDMPVVEDEEIFVYQNTSFSGSVASNDYELDIEELTYFIVDDNSAGIFQLEDDGNFFFIPGDDAIGTFNVEYMACDPCGACSFGVLTIEVGPLEGGNSAPNASNVETFVCAGESLIIDLNQYIFDLQDADQSLTLSYNQPSSGFVSLSGQTLTYYSNSDFVGTIEINYQVCDTGDPSLCTSAIITIDVFSPSLTLITDLYVENVSCVNGENGLIEIISTEPSTNVVVSWFNGASGMIQDGLSAGYYEFLLTSDAICSEPTQYGITVTEPSTGISVQADVIGITDEESGFIQLDVIGGQEPYSVSWSGISGTPDGTDLIEITSASTYYATIEDANGCALDTSFTVTGLNELMHFSSINCYPNPVDENLMIAISGLAGQLVTISIVDVTGQIVQRYPSEVLIHNHILSLNAEHLASGFYTVVIDNSKKPLMSTFIRR